MLFSKDRHNYNFKHIEIIMSIKKDFIKEISKQSYKILNYINLPFMYLKIYFINQAFPQKY